MKKCVICKNKTVKLISAILLILITFIVGIMFLSGCAKTGCEAGKHTVKKVVVEPTCGKAGKETSVCEKCKKVLEEKVLPATGEHTHDEGVVTRESTCTVKGEIHYHCADCGADCGTEELPLAPHAYELADEYWRLNGYEPATDTRCAVIPYGCSKCKGNFASEYKESDFAFAGDKIRLEDKYTTETAIVFDSTNKYLVINLAGGDKALGELETEGLYDSSSKILTLPVTYKSVMLDKIKVSGFKTPNGAFAISTQIGNRLTVILQNISYTAPQGAAGLDLGNINNATLETIGLVSVNGGGTMAGITARNLVIIGNDSLNVKGGDGINGKSGNGSDGGVGIKASKLTLSVDGEVFVSGGRGGAAYNRSAGDNDGEGSNGKNGYNGGKGGSGIVANEITITQGIYTVVGGDGGRGGDASECNRSEWMNTGSKNVVGGRGGNGGAGADALKTDAITISGGTVDATGGNGGDSGRAGGCHDRDYSGDVAFWGTTTATDGSYGSEGKGGKGLSDCTVEGDEALIIKTDGSAGEVNRELNQDG